MAWLTRKPREAAKPDTSALLRQALSLLLVGLAAVRSWPALGAGDRQLLAAWACSAVLLPAWKLANPRSYDASAWRRRGEVALRLFYTASPAAVSMSVLGAQAGMARAARLQNAALLILSVFTAKGGFWGGLHGLALSRPWWQQPGAHAAIWWARRKAQRRAAVSAK